MEKEIIEGVVEHITFTNKNNGYTVCDIASDNALVCAVGCMPELVCGETVRLTGQWTNNPAYGEQFTVELFERTMPKEVGTVLMYLASGIVKGIGEATARKIVDEFGKDALDIIAEEPERLAKIKGITKDKALAMQASFIEKKGLQSTVMFLQPYGVTVEFAMRAYNALGRDAVNRIKENPYVLCDKISGIGFESADKIAHEMNIGLSDRGRVQSGIKYVLQTVANTNGHTFLPEVQLTEYVSRMLEVDEEIVENQYTALLVAKEIVSFESYDEGKYIQLATYYRAESSIASRLMSLVKTPTDEETSGLDKYIRLSEEKSGIKLSAEQKYAVSRSIYGGVTVITGGPGTGKTTIIRTIIDCLDYLGATYALAAPTGRAAKRMSDSCSIEAKTIHRLLELGYGSDEMMNFVRDMDNPIEADFVIIDEMSMVDTMLMVNLMYALAPGTGLILLGDADQLPSVGAGSVLKDIISSEAIETLKLTHIYRQAAESMIVTNAHRINNGEVPYYNKQDNDFFLVTRENGNDVAKTVADLCSSRLIKKYGFDPKTDIQVLTPIKKSVIGVFSLNARLQAVLNPPGAGKSEYKSGDFIFREGDKIMQTENDYNIEWVRNGETGSGIYNGDMGIITAIDKKLGFIKVMFDDMREAHYAFAQLSELSLSYAITVHKSQGSEFECVIMPVMRCAPMLMTRNLFYTAVTRAKSLVVLVGMAEAAEEMVYNNSERKRYSALTDRLRERM